MLTPDLVLDGYRLIREIGRGGFGEVWLCRLEATGEYKALKFLSATNADYLERELAALIRYRSVATQIQCPHLISIEHVNRTQAGLFYVMPLADDQRDRQPEDPDWKAKTLDSITQDRRTASTWFSAEEIRSIILPPLDAAQRLSDAGIGHRDIKPENILLVGGGPCLGDISLVTDDASSLTRRGTPGYVAPSWYLESGGNPDMWGMATTLYTLVTGNPPDKLGRGAFLWPPQGKRSIEKKNWMEFHRMILRATQDRGSKRYGKIRDLTDELQETSQEKVRRLQFKAVARDILVMETFSIAGGFIIGVLDGDNSDRFKVDLCLFNIACFIIGNIIMGCIAWKNRWKHLLVVTVGLWLLGLMNIPFGVSFQHWCGSIVLLLVCMVFGGYVSGLIRKAPR